MEDIIATRHCTLVHGFCFFWLFLMVGKGLKHACAHSVMRQKVSASSHKHGACVGFWRDHAAKVCLAGMN